MVLLHNQIQIKYSMYIPDLKRHDFLVQKCSVKIYRPNVRIVPDFFGVISHWNF